MRLSGPIRDGDLARLKAVREKLPPSFYPGGVSFPLCLDSPDGGDLAEAIRIGAHIYETGIGTVIEENASCLSACAVVFMMGTVRSNEDDFLDRHLHVGGTLGFHRPELDLPLPVDGLYSLGEVEASFAAALETTADLLLLANRNAPVSNRPMIRSDLLRAMFLRRGEDYLFIDTVDKARRWGIRLFGYAELPSLDAAAAQHACDNLTRWQALRDPPEASQTWDPPRPDGDGYLVTGSNAGYLLHECRVRPAQDLIEVCGIDQSLGVRIGVSSFDLDGRFTCDVYWRYDRIAGLSPHQPLASLPRKPGDVPLGPYIHLAIWEDDLTQAFRGACRKPAGQRAAIAEVNSFATLRAAPGFDAAVTAEVPRFALVELTGAAPVFLGSPQRRSRCAQLCAELDRAEAPRNLFDDGSPEWRGLRDRYTTTCIAPNAVWYNATDATGRQGFVSGRVLRAPGAFETFER